jgi:hypothetical protein
MNSAIRRKRGPKPSGESKVVFYARVTQEQKDRLEAYLAAGCTGRLYDSLAVAAPGHEGISEVVERTLPVPVEAFKSPFPTTPTPKGDNPVKAKETPKKALPERPNFFKKP